MTRLLVRVGGGGLVFKEVDLKPLLSNDGVPLISLAQLAKGKKSRP